MPFTNVNAEKPLDTVSAEEIKEKRSSPLITAGVKDKKENIESTLSVQDSSIDNHSHIVAYSFRGYRCRWICSCGKSSSLHSTDTYLGSSRGAIAHLKKVGGDVNQPYKTI